MNPSALSLQTLITSKNKENYNYPVTLPLTSKQTLNQLIFLLDKDN